MRQLILWLRRMEYPEILLGRMEYPEKSPHNHKLDARPRSPVRRRGFFWKSRAKAVLKPREVNMADEQPTGKRNAARYAGLGIALGAGVGAAIGVATGNLEVWLAVGVGVGAAVGFTLSKKTG